MGTVRIDLDKHGMASVRLNRPEVHNALNEDMIRELTDCFDMLGRHADVRLITLRGEGKSFCGGGDLNWMKRAAGQSEAENHADALRLSKMFATVNACPKPVIGIVQGAALGGGTGLAACCDIVVAHTNASFGLTEVRLGLIAATISPFVIARIGAGQARRYMLTAERINVTAALSIGLVHEASDTPDDAVKPILAALLGNGPDAMADSKKLIADVAGREPKSDLLDMTAARIAARRASVEGREGIAAFLEKRKPGWAD